MRAAIVTLGTILAVAGCSAPGEFENVEAVPSAIVGGQPTPSCAFPTAVAYFTNDAKCSATLVHPKMITVAAHCMEGQTPIEITFGDSSTAPSNSARRVRIQSCTEKGGQAANEDFAYCILAEEVNDVPIVPILYVCETEIMRPGTTVVLVGYGYIAANTPSPDGDKRAVSLKVDAVNQKTIVMGDTTHGACFGDSGGPAYVKLPDGTWRVFGVTSGSAGSGAVCGALSEYAYTPYYVPWIEQTSGLDITPCYDADGTWHPDARCNGFPMNPDESDGTWAAMCTDNLTRSGPSSVCGTAIDAGKPPDTHLDAGGAVIDGGSSDGHAETGSSASVGSTVSAGGSAGTTDSGTGGSGGTDAVSQPAPGDASGGCSCRTRAATKLGANAGWMALGLGALALRRRKAAKLRGLALRRGRVSGEKS